MCIGWTNGAFGVIIGGRRGGGINQRRDGGANEGREGWEIEKDPDMEESS